MRTFSALLIAALFLFNHFGYSQYQFISPVPGSVDHNPEQNIIVRAGGLINANSLQKKNLFSVNGSLSGNHDFGIVLCRDQKTILLNPETPFTEGETVTVTIGSGLKRVDGTSVKGYNFDFTIHRKYSPHEKALLNKAREEVWEEEFGRVNGGDINEKNDLNSGIKLPPMYITTNTNPGPGEIFFHNYNFYGYDTYRHCIITVDGDSIYSSGKDGKGWDFKINKNGYLTMFNKLPAMFEMYDSSFNLVSTYSTQGGVLTDIHDFQIFPDGHYYLQGYSYTFKDLTIYDTSYNSFATIVGLVVQGFDSDKNKVFEWRSNDHMEVIEAPHANFTSAKVDYVHGNSIEEDYDGNLILSCRHLDQVIKIDINTGNFLWRLGGMKNEFTFINDSIGFCYQHDARRLPNGNLTIFDNGNYHTELCSYAREYQLDEVNKTATLVWSYKHPQINGLNVISAALGNVQRLSNGNTFINWGAIAPDNGNPNLTEVTPDGEIVWEMHLKDKYNDVMYRAFKFEWDPCARTTGSKMKASNITDHSAKAKWSVANGALSYKLQYRKAGDTAWINKTISDGENSKVLKNLTPATTYEWHVLSKCDEGEKSGYSEIATFTTLPLKQELINTEVNLLDVFPNPASNEIRIRVPVEMREHTTVQIFSIFGSMVYQAEYDSGTPDNPLIIPVTGFPAGVYMLCLKSGAKSWVEKVEVE